MKKKGQLINVVVGAIIAVVIMIVLFIVVDQWRIYTENMVKEKICSFSVVIKDKVSLFGFESDYELKCDPSNIVVTEADTGYVIAKKMNDCWEMLGEGERDIVSSYSFTADTACIPCSKIYPKKGEIRISLKDIESKINLYNEDDEGTAFINRFTREDKQLKFETNEEFVITKENPLYVTYFFYKLREGDIELFHISSVGSGIAFAKYGTKAMTFVAKKAAGKAVSGAVLGTSTGGVGLVAGVLTEVVYRDDLRQGFAIMSGKEIVEGCEELK